MSTFPLEETVLLLIIEDGKILLAMKKRGFGKGRWNGVGGKLEPGETPEQACIRECQEEIEVTPGPLEKVAEHHFRLNSLSETITTHTYITRSYSGTPTETEEMAPQWFAIADIPYNEMWQDDVYWLPAVLSGRKLSTNFVFDAEDIMQSAEITEVDTLAL